MEWPHKKRSRSESESEDDKCDEVLYTMNNHIHFNGDVTQSSMFRLAKELRTVATALKVQAITIQPLQPIWLHVTTDGGLIYAALSIVDCIRTLGVPVYSVVDGYVASAGTIITLAAAKRFIQPNAYMLIHQLSSGVWGKMSAIEDEVGNLKKLMDHLTKFYSTRTTLRPKALNKLLLRDVNWNADESIARGLVDNIYEE